MLEQSASDYQNCFGEMSFHETWGLSPNLSQKSNEDMMNLKKLR